MAIVIDHEAYGMRTEFASLAEAQAAIRECGIDFADATLTLRGSHVYDELGRCVGEEQ